MKACRECRFSRGGQLFATGEGGTLYHATGREMTARAGAAYAFRRVDNASEETCANEDSGNRDPEYCVWRIQAKLMASDRRAGDRFGSSVAIDDTEGTATIGAPHAAGLSLFKTRPANHPYMAGSTTPVGLPFDAVFDPLNEAQRTLARARGGQRAVWALERRGLSAGTPLL